MTMHCPLCSSTEYELYHQSIKPLQRDYMQCGRCHLVWVPERFHVEPIFELAEYELHDNQINDIGYQRFLNKVVPHICAYFGISHSITDAWLKEFALKHANTSMRPAYVPIDASGLTGLDYGCGTVPALALQLVELGFSMQVFDKYFASYPDNLNTIYDFVVSTETIEHIYQAKDTWALWEKLINRTGCLVVMTQRVKHRDAFATWRYIHDPTHICFYSDHTAQYIADTYQLQLKLINQDIMFFSR